jgi:hypothetical protein
MSSSTQKSLLLNLQTAVVLSVTENMCRVWSARGAEDVDFASFFPSERTKRVSPGHLVAIASRPNVDAGLIVWRWFDAVVISDLDDRRVHIWEPAHGAVVAELRPEASPAFPGSRMWASSGLPGAEWWVANPVAERPETAGVDLDELSAFLIENELWP